MSDLKTLFRALKEVKPPYICPVENCGKTLKNFTGAKIHMYKFHNRRPKRPKENKDDIAKNNVITNCHEDVNYAETDDTFEIFLSGHTHILHVNDQIDFIDDNENIEKEFNDNSILYSEKAGCAITSNKPSNHIKNRKFSTSNSLKKIEPSFRLLENYNPQWMPSRSSTYYKYNDEMWDNVNKEVEYDMDDEDSGWLSIINEKRKSAGYHEINEDIFELLMDRLEKESYFHCQSNVEETLACIDENAVCCICNDGECDDSNAILFCDVCNLPVHQECYGVPFIPEGQWLCRKCTFSPSFPVNCVLCPNQDGAFKQTDDSRWAHVICALWIPEVGFKNPNFLEPIDSLQNIPRARWKLCCYICKRKDAGACIQCKKSSCYTAFHVTCAQSQGLFMEMKAIKANGTGDGAYEICKSAFCQSHTPETPSIKDSGSDDCDNSSDRTTDGSKGMQTLTELSVPVTSIPNISPKVLTRIIKSLNVDLDYNIIERVLAFWKLKRQSKGGAPLLRRLQVTVYPQLKQEPKGSVDAEDVRLLIKLRQDFERARLLLEMIQKREKIKQKLIEIQRIETNLQLQPFVIFLLQTLDVLQAYDVHDVFAEPVNVALVPDYLDIIKDPMDFSTMRKKIESFKYNCFSEFEDDFNLMLNNCLLYNAKDTVYYKLAFKMRQKCSPILEKARENVTNELNSQADLFVEDVRTQYIKQDTERKVSRNFLQVVEQKQIGHKHSKTFKGTCHIIPSSKVAQEITFPITLNECSTLVARIGSDESDEENGIHSSSFNFKSSRAVVMKKMRKRCIKFGKFNRKSAFKASSRCLRSSVNQLPVSSTKTKVPQNLLTASHCIHPACNSWSSSRRNTQFSIEDVCPSSQNVPMITKHIQDDSTENRTESLRNRHLRK